MEQFFSNLFEDARHERSLLLSPTDINISKQGKFTDDEIDKKNLALE